MWAGCIRACPHVHRAVLNVGLPLGWLLWEWVFMGVEIESLFTSALGLQAPWAVESVELDTTKHRIDFEVRCKAKTLTCPHCGATDQGIHDRMRREWRHLDFFQFEAWLHAEVPRVACKSCGKTTQVPVP